MIRRGFIPCDFAFKYENYIRSLLLLVGEKARDGGATKEGYGLSTLGILTASGSGR